MSIWGSILNSNLYEISSEQESGLKITSPYRHIKTSFNLIKETTDVNEPSSESLQDLMKK